jgi:hypothetical protein
MTLLQTCRYSFSKLQAVLKHPYLQERSGRVALPRAKVKPAAPALEVAEAPERRATRAELLRRAAIVDVYVED